LPLYRQAEIYARGGIDLDRSTLADWVGQSARLMRPLVEAVGLHVMSAERVHADDTTVPVLDPGRGKTKTGRVWCYVRDDQPFGGQAPPAVLYCYSPDRKGEHPRQHLAGFRGILQADGYAGCAGLYDHGVTEAACLAHARRKFFDVHASTQSPLALEALQRIAALYAIEATIRGQPPDARLAARTMQSASLFTALRQWLESSLSRVSGKSDLASAIRYTLSRWDALTLVLRDGRACIDNNAAERSMRPMTMARSLYPSCSSLWKHWDLIFWRGVTRAGFVSHRRDDPRVLEVDGPDLIGRTGDDLLGGQHAERDQAANAVGADVARLCGFAQCQPIAVLICRSIGADAPDTSDRAYPMCRPRLALSGRQPHAVQSGGDVLVGPAAGHAPDHRQGIVGGDALVLTRSGLAQSQLGVATALPVDCQNDLVACLIDVDGDVVHECPHQLLTRSHGDRGRRPSRIEVLSKVGEVGDGRHRGGHLRSLQPRLALAHTA
jgi:hypothetical protein